MTTQAAKSPAKPARVTKRRAQTRARLLDAAYRVFADLGFGRVRIEDVCAAAGYTRGAFYSQFDSLDELFFTLYDERAIVIADQVTQALSGEAGDPSPDAAIDRIAKTLLLDRDWLLVKTDFLLRAARNSDVAQRLITHRGLLRDVIEQRVIATGIDIPTTLGSAAQAAQAVIAAYDGVTVQILLDNDLNAARAHLKRLLAALLLPSPHQ
ncbi:TetR/AcrR family transcriptional regulator [Nocardia aurantiaca]|uniref:TetR family transcriptional regulator n=1 Tax=Nocardia aurantiaca TaxID=2675850 RepID=A0A6I3L5Z2_9NOCA|nr:TetR/AcrR family transcriptional regulator [Nocardia aurantiaca]MTE16921.1 TetR family transcriptional regulator [Nocardia aurantiaca]